MLKYIALGLMMAVVAAAAIVRVRPVAPDLWHVEPAGVASKDKDGRFTVTEGGDLEGVIADLTLEQTLAILKTRIEGTPRTTLLDGALEDGFATYVTRSKLWGFPDVTNVKLTAVDGGTQIEMAARLVYGKLDMGVNEARVRDWLAPFVNQ